MNNKNLRSANKNKKDEFYTQYEDIEKELMHYKRYLKDKIIYCNCDDYRISNFYKYFKNNFKELGLKLLYTSCYIEGGKGIGAIYNGIEEKEITLKDDGDFRSEECINALKKCDIVVTNPPFSLFRDFMSILTSNKKDVVVIGSMNAISYKEIFPLIKNNKIFLGVNSVKSFIEPNGDIKKFGNILWYTTFNIRNNDYIELTKKYSSEKYPKYDNYDAINVDRVKDIPNDYYGLMGVPITFLDKYNTEQFKIINGLNRYVLLGEEKINKKIREEHSHGCNINGKSKYFRIIIQRIKEGYNE